MVFTLRLSESRLPAMQEHIPARRSFLFAIVLGELIRARIRLCGKSLAAPQPLAHHFRMPELKDFAGSVAVLVSSCDVFFDVWKPFSHFFAKFWPDCPFPVCLIANELAVRSDVIRTIAVGEDRGWASNMKIALREIVQPRVLYFQEDYFLNAPVRPEQLASDLDYAFALDVDSLCLRARSELEPGFQPINERFGVVPPDSDGRTRCQLTLWKRDALLAVLRDGESAWEMESHGSERTRQMRVLSYSTRENLPVPYLMSAVVRGIWAPEALAMCERERLKITPRFRGIYTSNALLRRFRRARARAAFRRERAKIRNGVIDLNNRTGF